MGNQAISNYHKKGKILSVRGEEIKGESSTKKKKFSIARELSEKHLKERTVSEKGWAGRENLKRYL